MEQNEIKNAVTDAVAEIMENRAKLEAEMAAQEAEKKAVYDLVKAEALKDAKAEAKTWAASKGFNIKEVTELGDDEAELNRAFLHYMKTGDETVARKALQEDDAGEGGYLVPDDFMSGIVEKRDAASWVRRSGVQVVQTNRDKIDIPAEGTSFAKFTRTAEEASYTTNDPAFIQNQVVVENWTKIFKVSEQLLDDNDANLTGFLSNGIARSMVQTEAYYSAVGSGTNQHEGIFTGGDTDALTFDSSANVTPDELWELLYILGSGYHANAIWLMDPQSWRYILSIRDSNNWAFSAADMARVNVPGADGELLGKKVFLQDDIPDILTGTGSGVIAVGDPYFYALVERKGLAVRRLNELYAANGQIGFKCDFRQSGKVLLEEAFKIGVMA